MAVSSALANIALGLITSVVGGAAVWLWQHLAVRRSRRAKESFFGLARGTGCLIIFNNAAGRRGAMHHHRTLARTLPDLRRFALMLQVTASDAFGHEAAALAADVTRPAFAPALRSGDPAAALS